jgi:hypothetical protein
MSLHAWEALMLVLCSLRGCGRALLREQLDGRVASGSLRAIELWWLEDLEVHD